MDKDKSAADQKQSESQELGAEAHEGLTGNPLTINNTPLTPIELHGQRVITLAMMDKVHARPEGTARRNFNTNRDKLIEGEDYFVRNSSEAKSEFGLIAPNGVTLLTETGYLMLVKSFTDDLAWKVQRELVRGYFRARATEAATSTTNFGQGIAGVDWRNEPLLEVREDVVWVTSAALSMQWELPHSMLRDAIDQVFADCPPVWVAQHVKRMEFVSSISPNFQLKGTGYALSRDGFVFAIHSLGPEACCHPLYPKYLQRFDEMRKLVAESVPGITGDMDLDHPNRCVQNWYHLHCALGGEYGRALMVWHMLRLNAFEVPVRLSLRDWADALDHSLGRGGVDGALASLVRMGVVIRTGRDDGILLDRGALKKLLENARKMGNRILLMGGNEADLPPVRDVIVSLRSDQPNVWVEKAPDRESIGNALDLATGQPRLPKPADRRKLNGGRKTPPGTA